MNVPDEFLSDIVHAGFRVICVDRGEERLVVQVDLHGAILFSAKFLLFPLFQYSVGIHALLEGIPDGLEGVLRWDLDHGRHGCVECHGEWEWEWRTEFDRMMGMRDRKTATRHQALLSLGERRGG